MGIPPSKELVLEIKILYTFLSLFPIHIVFVWSSNFPSTHLFLITHDCSC